MMNRTHKIFAVIFLGLGATAHAQDTIPVQLIREQTSAITGIRDGLYSSPALKTYQRQNNYATLAASFRQYNQDLYLQQEGNGQQTFTVHSETYLKKSSQLTLWGKAYYNTQQQYAVRFNETADYQIVYPYVMADSIGGDLKAETYAFSGGLAKAAGAYQLGFSAGYRGQQSYRDRDPRPKNISSEINLTLAASRKLNEHYVLALDLDGTKYSQKNELNFVSELGKPFVYHDAGLGVYNQLLTGSLLKAWFNGLGYGASLQLSPLQNKGWFAGATLHQLNLKKRSGKPDGSSIYDVGTIKEQSLNGQLGYLYEQGRRHFIAKATATGVKRKGIEAIFDIRDSQTGIVNISEAPRYLHQYNTFQLRSVYGKTGGFADWYAGIDGNYEDHLQRYALPDREMSYQFLQAGADVTVRKQLGVTMLTLDLRLQRQENLTNHYSWGDVDPGTAIYTMLHTNFAYLTASGMRYSGGARVDFPVTAKLSCYVKAAYGYETTIGRREFNILTAFQF